MEFGIIVHGGAWAIPDEFVQDHLNGVRSACQTGNNLLEEGNKAIDVVEHVVKVLEDDPTFDAGIGSHLNSKAEVEMDAIIASDDYKIGSVAAIQHVKNPVQVARLVRDMSEHVLLVGKGASDFAYTHGIKRIQTEKLLVGREKRRYQQIMGKNHFSTKDPFRKDKSQGFGTVGAVVKDKSGKYAIAVSTGGTAHKLAGRIGDTPLWGSGGYVNKIGGAAATGFGEDLIRVLATRTTIQYLEQVNPMEAAKSTINHLENEVQGLGGIICINKDDIGFAFNTPRMAFAYQKENESIVVGIEPSDLPY